MSDAYERRKAQLVSLMSSKAGQRQIEAAYRKACLPPDDRRAVWKSYHRMVDEILAAEFPEENSEDG